MESGFPKLSFHSCFQIKIIFLWLGVRCEMSRLSFGTEMWTVGSMEVILSFENNKWMTRKCFMSRRNMKKKVRKCQTKKKGAKNQNRDDQKSYMGWNASKFNWYVKQWTYKWNTKRFSCNPCFQVDKLNTNSPLGTHPTINLIKNKKTRLDSIQF